MRQPTAWHHAGLALLAFAGLSPRAALADPVTDWSAIAGAAARAACISPADDPLRESRMYAMTHLAVHDALNAIERRYATYAHHAPAPAGTSVEAAVAAAARGVLVSQIAALPFPFPPACIAGGTAQVEAAYGAALAAIPDGPARAAGVALGEAAAAAIVARRVGDGSDTPLLVFDHPQGDAPGEWRFTPGLPFAVAPGWGAVTPFALQRADQFRPPPPYDVACRRPAERSPLRAPNCRRYARDLAEVKALGGDGIGTPSARTADQTEIALFWVESSPLQWNRIARKTSDTQGLDTWERARLHALLNMAMADGYVASFAAKYHYNFWRPVTAIHEGANDGNPRTGADPAWTPLRPTPPIPDHDSAHAVQGASAAEVMRRVYGTEEVAFGTCSLSLDPGQTCDDAQPTLRHFGQLSQAARENAMSRIYVGFHFRRAAETGLTHGRDIGRHTVRTQLGPVR
jgi:hypothetical protein